MKSFTWFSILIMADKKSNIPCFNRKQRKTSSPGTEDNNETSYHRQQKVEKQEVEEHGETCTDNADKPESKDVDTRDKDVDYFTSTNENFLYFVLLLVVTVMGFVTRFYNIDIPSWVW